MPKCTIIMKQNRKSLRALGDPPAPRPFVLQQPIPQTFGGKFLIKRLIRASETFVGKLQVLAFPAG